MKTCIWCSRSEPSVTFKKRAHTIPASLGGNKVCDQVCDSCNHSFGSPTKKAPSVEVVLKEAFNLSRYVLDWHTDKTNKKLGRYKSEYFNINFGTRTPVKLKPRFKVKDSYLDNLGRQLRRGIFKIFLEERMRVKSDALDTRYDFIRQFARYDLNDIPVYFFVPIHQVILSTYDAIEHPSLNFNEDSEKIMNEYRYYQFSFVGHTLAIPVSNLHHVTHTSYEKYSLEQFRIYSSMEPLIKFNDLDLLFMRTLKD